MIVDRGLNRENSGFLLWANCVDPNSILNDNDWKNNPYNSYASSICLSLSSDFNTLQAVLSPSLIGTELAPSPELPSSEFVQSCPPRPIVIASAKL
jgi:hypothetical protein